MAVYRRPRIAFFSTGDELASIGRPLAPGEVYDSNRYSLYGALTGMGMEVLDLGVVRDDPAALERTFREAAGQADAILTTGGVSVGEADYVREIMARLGEVRFWRIDIKPGRPMAFGRLGDAWLFGLPGNPVAVLVSFYQIVLDALRRLQGLDPLPIRPSFRVPCDSPIRKVPGRREFPAGCLIPGRRPMAGAPVRQPGVRGAALHDRCQLLHLPGGGLRQRRPRGSGGGAALRRGAVNRAPRCDEVKDAG